MENEHEGMTNLLLCRKVTVHDSIARKVPMASVKSVVIVKKLLRACT